VIGWLGDRAKSDWTLRKVGGWRGGREGKKEGRAGRRGLLPRRVAGGRVGPWRSAGLRGSLRPRARCLRSPLDARRTGEAVAALGEGRRSLPRQKLAAGLGQ